MEAGLQQAVLVIARDGKLVSNCYLPVACGIPTIIIHAIFPNIGLVSRMMPAPLHMFGHENGPWVIRT